MHQRQRTGWARCGAVDGLAAIAAKPRSRLEPKPHPDVVNVHAIGRALVEGHAGRAPDLAQALQDGAPAGGRGGGAGPASGEHAGA